MTMRQCSEHLPGNISFEETVPNFNYSRSSENLRFLPFLTFGWIIILTAMTSSILSKNLAPSLKQIGFSAICAGRAIKTKF